jgi:hypothetical protein
MYKDRNKKSDSEAETQIKMNKTTYICKKTEIKGVTMTLNKNRDKRSESGAETYCR